MPHAGNYVDGGLVTGDFNGDGRLDLALSYLVPMGESAVLILLGNGDGRSRRGRPTMPRAASTVP